MGAQACTAKIGDFRPRAVWNTTHRANESVHYKNMTYSPEMYGMEMDLLIKAH